MTLRWAEMTAAERERAYSPSTCVPDGDYSPYIEAYRARSDQAWSAAGAPWSVVAYGHHPMQTVDLVVPSAGRKPPLLVFIHGGYWQELSKEFSRFAATSALSRGWAFAAVDYRLAPEVSLDEIVDDCRNAVGHVVAAAVDRGANATRVVVAGSSAGAHLAAMVALDRADQDRSTVAGLVLVSGVYELEPLIGTSINDRLGLDVAAARRNSPLHMAPDAMPPTLLAYGSNETGEFKAQTDSFARLAGGAGVSTTSIEITDRNHFDVILDLAEPNTVLGDAVAELVASTGGRV
ncbi:MAG: alpha/beta hydrolase [Actinomycetota bacterium]